MYSSVPDDYPNRSMWMSAGT